MDALVVANGSSRREKDFREFATSGAAMKKFLHSFRAIRLFSTELEQSEILSEKATVRFSEGNYTESLHLFQQSLSLCPSPDTHYNIATCQMLLKNYKESLNSFNKTLDLDPNHVDSLVNVGNIYAALKHSDKAIECLSKARDLSQDDGEIRFNLGVVLDAVGRYEEAATEYEKAIECGVTRAHETLRGLRLKMK